MANFITLLRIFLAFIAVGILFIERDDGSNFAFISFTMTILVMWFDGLDGFVARKLNQTSKIGAVLDIMGDRIVECIYWISFAAMGWIPVSIPLIVVTRGIITDSLRSLALAKGYTAFGEKTMIQDEVSKFIVTSNFSRFTYAVAKAFAFLFILLGSSSLFIAGKDAIFYTGCVCSVVAVIFCVLRGIPVLFESKRFLKDEQE